MGCSGSTKDNRPIIEGDKCEDIPLQEEKDLEIMEMGKKSKIPRNKKMSDEAIGEQHFKSGTLALSDIGSLPAIRRKLTLPAINSGSEISQLIPERKDPILTRYDVLGMIGERGYGKVKKVRDKVTNETKALKVLPISKCRSAVSSDFLSEVSVLGKLDHPNIIKLYELSQEKDNYYYKSQHNSSLEL